MKVDFIGIGAQKSATSWLHHVLAEHPEICASKPKELNFFTANYDKGYTWYEDHFARCAEGAISGECSPTYFFSDDAPRRAARYNAGLRLIAVLRDPVARAFSNHLHEIRKAHIPQASSFEDALLRNPAYVLQGQYKRNLTRWLDCFDREAMIVLLAEDIASDPQAAYRSVCRHLGVGDQTEPAGLAERRHESIASKSRLLQKGLRLSGDAMRQAGLGKTVSAVKKIRPVQAMLRLNARDLRKEVPAMSNDTREHLTQEFRPDVEFVADLLGRANLPWDTWRALCSESARLGNVDADPVADAC